MKRVTWQDLIDESPECEDPKNLPHVLGHIYRQIATPEEFTNDTPTFVTVTHPRKPLTDKNIGDILARLQRKTGITISSHRLRKFFETQLSTEISHPIWLKYWMGHKVRGKRADIEGRYIIPPENVQREAYIEAYKHIDLAPGIDKVELAVTEFKIRAETLSPEQRRRFLEEITKKLNLSAEVFLSDPEIKRLLEEPCSEADGACMLEYRQIHESKLLQHLQAGWQIVHNLGNGDVIVKR